MTEAFDLAQPMTDAQFAQAKAAGVPAIIRYLWSGGKGVTKDEFALSAKYQIPLVLVYEGRGDLISSYTVAQAKKDAATALHLLSLLGVPKHACVYFCADDFDASNAQILANIGPYFAALAPLIRAEDYRVGDYGNGAACEFLLDAGTVDLAWLWGVKESNGSPEFSASNRWSIRQHAPSHLFGLSIDPDDVQGDFGGFIPGNVPVAPTPTPAPTPVEPTIVALASHNLRAGQVQLANAGLYPANEVDGDWGPKTIDALRQWFTEE